MITGIGPGLGSKLALAALEQGASVVLASRNTDRLIHFEESAVDKGFSSQSILKHPADITDRGVCDALADHAVSHFGRIDALINSAYDPGSFSSVDRADLDSWQRPMQVNLFGTLQLTQAVVPHMRAHGGGSIVMVNTMAVHKPMLFNGGYAASKAALASASAHLALELGADNIRVNSVYLGWMWGTSVEEYMRGEAQQRGVDLETVKAEVIRQIPLGRIPTDDECAKAALFFASDLSSVVTGASLDVNGGDFMPH